MAHVVVVTHLKVGSEVLRKKHDGIHTTGAHHDGHQGHQHIMYQPDGACGHLNTGLDQLPHGLHSVEDVWSVPPGGPHNTSKS